MFKFLRWRDWSLAVKLSVLIIAVLLAALGASTLAEEARGRAQEVEQAHERNLQRARATAQLLDIYLASVDANVQLIAVAPGTLDFLERVAHDGDTAEIAQVLLMARDRGRYDAAALVDPLGQVLIATDTRLVGRNYTTATWFRNAVAGRATVDEPRYDVTDGQVYLHVSAPITTPRGQVMGAAVVRLTMEPIDGIVAADLNYDGRGAYGVLFDENGIRLSHPSQQNLRYVPLAPLPPDLVTTMVYEARFGPTTETLLRNATRLDAVVQRGKSLLYDDRTEPHIAYQSAAAGSVEAALAPLENKRWVYNVASPQEGLFAHVSEHSRSALGEALVIGLIVTIASLLAARVVTRPIRRVAETANALAAGDLSRRVRLNQQDEVGRLAAAFDAMAESLADKDAQLRGYAGQLERKVQERTGELVRRAGEFAALYETARDIAEQAELTDLLKLIAERAAKLLDTPYGAVFMYDPVRQDLELVASKDPIVPPGTRLKLGEGMAGRVALTRKPLIVDNYHAWEQQSPIFARASFTAVIEVPMLYRGEVVGVLAALATDPSARKFTDADARLLSLLASQAAGAVRNARLLQETEARAQQLALLYDAGLTLNRVLDPHLQIDFLLKIAMKAVGADRAEFYRCDTARGQLRFEQGLGPDDTIQASLRGWDIPLGEERGIVGWVAKHHLPQTVPNLPADPRWVAFDPALRSGVWTPVEREGQPLGVLAVLSTRLDAFTSSDERLLMLFANQIAVAMENARLLTTEREQRQLAENLRAQTELRLQRLSVVRNIDLAITASLDVQLTLSVLLEQITAQLRLDAAAVLLLNRPAQRLEFAAGRGFRTGALQHTRLRMGQGHAGQAARERRIISVADFGSRLSDFPPSAIPMLQAEGFVTYYAAPLVTKGQVKGVLEIFHRSPHSADAEWLEFLESLAAQAAIAIDNAEMFDGAQRSSADLAIAYETTLEGWSRALDLRDKETEGHTQRVTELTVALARAMGLSDAELAQVRRGALLHDIGKMGVPDAILLKPGALTDDEWVIMRQHPQYAYDLLAPIAYLRPALDIPYYHHEKWDGTGYPQGLKGQEIPLAARVFAVVDVWDALISDRPYRPAWTKAKAREHIRAEAGTHFDPSAVEAFMRVLDSADDTD